MTWTTTEASRVTGIPMSTLKLMVAQGYIHPAVMGYGPSDPRMFNELNLAQARALAAARTALGNGSAFRDAAEQIAAVVRPGTPAVSITVEVPF